MDTVKIVEFIETTLMRRGKGVDNDPIRIVTQYWDLEGNLRFEVDEWADRHRVDCLVSLPTEDEAYAELDRRFNAKNDEKLKNDDTQIGWEECYKWMKQKIK